MSADDQNVKIDGLKYKISWKTKEAKVTKYQYECSENILIPKSITYFNREFEVTEIEEEAFTYSKIKWAVFDPNSKIQTIPIRAFENSPIEKVIISPHITTIGLLAFLNCFKLREIVIPSNSHLTTIKGGAFSKTQIENIMIPSSLTQIAENWYINTPKLSNITVMPGNPVYIDYKGKYLLGKSQQNNEHFDALLFVGRNVKTAEVPSTIEIIGMNSFEMCTLIKELILLSQVKVIKKLAFNCCISLKKFVIPYDSKLQILGSKALFGTGIKSLIIPRCVKSIEVDSLSGLEKLIILAIDERSEIDNITIKMFQGCSNAILMIPSNIMECIHDM